MKLMKKMKAKFQQKEKAFSKDAQKAKSMWSMKEQTRVELEYKACKDL